MVSMLTCEGKIKLSNAPGQSFGGLAVFEKQQTSWTCSIYHQFRIEPEYFITRIILTAQACSYIPHDLERMGCDGRLEFGLKNPDGPDVHFHTTSRLYWNDHLPSVGRLLANIRSNKEYSGEDECFGTAVHDMSGGFTPVEYSRGKPSHNRGSNFSNKKPDPCNLDECRRRVFSPQKGPRSHQNRSPFHTSRDEDRRKCYSARSSSNKWRGRSQHWRSSDTCRSPKSSSMNDYHKPPYSYRQPFSAFQPLRDRGYADNSQDGTNFRHGTPLNRNSQRPPQRAFMASNRRAVERMDDSRETVNDTSPRLGSRMSRTGLTNNGVVKHDFYRKSPTPSPYISRLPAASPPPTNTKRPSLGLLATRVQPKKNRTDFLQKEDKENHSVLNHSVSTHSVSNTTRSSFLHHGQGFTNVGNTCYMNAVLQALCILRPLSENILLVYRETQSWLPGRSLLKCVCELMTERSKAGSSYASSHFEPLLKNIKTTMDSLFKNFKGSGMQDAQEFMAKLLERISEEIDNALQEAQSSMLSPLRCCNPIKHYFEYNVKEDFTCVKCLNVVSKTQVLFDMVLCLPKLKKVINGKSLQSYINSLYKPEKREFRCEKCQHLESIVNTAITGLPRFLNIHLKRYVIKGDGVAKNTLPVTVSKYLTVKRHTLDDVQYMHRVNQSSLNSSDDSSFFYCAQLSSNECSSPNLALKRGNATSDSYIDKPPDVSATRLFGGGHGPTPVGANSASHQQPSKTVATPNRILTGRDEGLTGSDDVVLLDVVNVPDVTEHQTVAEDVAAQSNTNGESDEKELLAANHEKSEIHLLGFSQDDDDENLQRAKEISLLEFEETQAKNRIAAETENEADEDEAEDEEDGNEEENLLGELPHSYQLSVAVCHRGSAHVGHYVSYAYDVAKSCFQLYDDKSVTTAEEKDVLSKLKEEGYLYIYVHKDLVQDV